MKNHAFTLIELLVVVLIIGILAAIALPQYQKAVVRSRYAGLMAIVKHIQEAQEVFYLANGAYAANCEELGIDVPGNMELTEDKELLSTDEKMKFSCNWYGKSAMGALLGTNKALLMSYEHFLGQTSNAASNKGMCWATIDDSLYEGVCKNFCGYIEYNSGNYPVCFF